MLREQDRELKGGLVMAALLICGWLVLFVFGQLLLLAVVRLTLSQP